jgi:hypothetical protein
MSAAFQYNLKRRLFLGPYRLLITESEPKTHSKRLKGDINCISILISLPIRALFFSDWIYKSKKNPNVPFWRATHNSAHCIK